jgi:hypothetical protein
MAIDKDLKKKVTQDWLTALPQLSLYAQNKFYEVVGPLIIGLELIKLPHADKYRPHFVVYPLWKKDENTSLDFPFILRAYINEKGLQYSIAYDEHGDYFDEVIESIKKYTPLLFDDSISLEQIVDLVDDYSKTSYLSAAPNSYLQAALQEAKFKTTLFIDRIKAQSILEQIKTRSWDLNHFKAFGVDANGWFRGLEETLANQDEFLTRIEKNKLDKKIAQLKSSTLTASP